MRRLIARISALLVGLAILYLALWPVDVNPVAWSAPSQPAAIGPFAPNTKLATAERISLGPESQPEHVVLAADGWLYASVTHGAILRMHPDGTAQELFANTGGRVLGFAFDASGKVSSPSRLTM